MLRQAKPPLVAVVRLRKRNEWVLPKGKLDDGETPRDAAEREVNEETGHDVIVHEFLGTLVYESNGRSKIVHYWRMQADGEQVYELMTDIREVDWLPLEVALLRLSRASERAFLEHVGPVAVAAAIADLSKRKAKAAPPAKKRRPRTPAPAKPKPTAPVLPPPAAAVPAQLAEQGAAPIEPAPVAPEMPVAIASEAFNSSEAFDSSEALDSTPPVETQAPLPMDQSQLEQSADPQAPDVVGAEVEASTYELEAVVVAEIDPAPAVEAAETTAPDSTPVDNQTGTVEPRRKTLAEKLRNWLGSAA